MSTISLIVTTAALVVIASLFYLRVVAGRAGLHQEKEHWMVFGVFAGRTMGSGRAYMIFWSF